MQTTFEADPKEMGRDGLKSERSLQGAQPSGPIALQKPDESIQGSGILHPIKWLEKYRGAKL